MKKIYTLLLILFLSSSFVFSQNNNIEISIPKFDKDGNLTETIYTKEYPSNYKEAIETIVLLNEIYNQTSESYKNQILEYEKNSKIIKEELDRALKENKQLSETLKSKKDLDKATESIEKSNILKDNFESIGIIGGYGINRNSNIIDIQLGIKLWKFTISIGPEIIVPYDKEESIDVGLDLALGIWF